MKRILITLLALLIIPLTGFASGKMILGQNESITLEAQTDLPGPEYKWVLLKNDEIQTTKTGQHFTHLFTHSGDYLLNLIATSSLTNEIENSSVEILVGAAQKFTDSLRLKINSFPSIENQSISVTEANNSVNFILSESRGDIKEYRIDADIQTDSDGDGNPANDIDNIDDDSFKNGTLWAYNYDTSLLPTTASLSIIDTEGEVLNEDITIRLQESLPNDDGTLKAVIETAPKVSDDKRIHLQEDEATIYIFTGNSEGNIIEYRLDTDIEIDSDGDGNPKNDIDNLSHPSFKNGEVFEYNINRALGDKIIQLTIVSADGKGSLIQRKIMWDNAKELINKQEFRLYADSSKPYTGQTVHFGLEGVESPEDFEIKWDFNGDQSTDLEGNSTLATYSYDTEGDYEVLVQIKNEKLRILKYATIPVSVQTRPVSAFTTKAPIANFNTEIDENKVEFTSTSSVDNELINKDLSYEWSFGDGTKSTKANPVHVYKTAENFITRLKVTDTTGQSHEKRSLIEVTSINEEYLSETIEEEIIEEEPITEKDKTIEEETPEIVIPEVTEQEKKESEGSIFGAFFISFILLILFAGGAIVAYLFYQKVKNPDYTFGEIIEEEKEKMLSILEGREYMAPSGEIVAAGEEVKEDVNDILDNSDEAAEIKKEIQDEKTEISEAKEPEKNAEEILDAADADIVETPKEETIRDVPVVEDLNEKKDMSPKIESPIQEKPSTTPKMKEETLANDDVPDWLKDTAPTPSPEYTPAEPAAPAAPVEPSAPPADIPPVPPVQDVPPTPPAAPETPPTDNSDDDIPDWLK